MKQLPHPPIRAFPDLPPADDQTLLVAVIR